MTGNEFNAEYKLGQRIASSSVESYLAHVTATRRLVMVHRMAGANDGERRRIRALLDALPTRSTTVLARLDVDGEPVIVTEFLPDFVNLRDWLESAVAVQTTVVIRTGLPTPPRAAPPAEPEPPQAAGGNDFTRIFGQPLSLGAPTPPTASPAFVARDEPAPQGPPAAPPAPTITPAAPAETAAPAPGSATESFTAIFGAAPVPTPPSVAPPAPIVQPPVVQPPVAQPPVLQQQVAQPQAVAPEPTPVAPPQVPKPPVTAPPVAAQQPGNFTALFGAPVAPPAPPLASHASTPTPSASTPSAPPRAAPGGEFTQMFGAAAASSTPPPSSQSPGNVAPPGLPPAASPPAYAPPPQAHAPVPPAPPSRAPNASDVSVPTDPGKIRVMWRPREGATGPTGGDAPPPSATNALAPTPPRAPDPGPPPMFAPPPARPTTPPFAAPQAPVYGATPLASSSASPDFPTAPPFAAPRGASPFDAPSMSPSPRGDAQSLGPPELRLFANEAGERVEPHAPPPVPSSGPAPRASGPSDFTRMLTPVEAVPSTPAPAAVKPAPKAEPAAGGRRPSMLPLIIVIMFAFVSAAALIVFFALRK